ncbi:MAG: DNA adenine methylase [Dehalococcoidia bacterium]
MTAQTPTSIASRQQLAAPTELAHDVGLRPIATAPQHIAAQPLAIKSDPGTIDHALAEGRYQTPLRYPGAKTGLANLIGTLITAATESTQVQRVDLLVEPFAGGASTSLRLVGQGTVGRVLLADADPLVAAFWQVAASRASDLIARMHEEPVTLDRWDYWRSWAPRPGTAAATARFEAAVKCLFLNRTTFSGILHGRAGPVGGRTQNSDYDIGCRFNKDALAGRISYVGHLYDTRRLVDVWCLDWQSTLDKVASVYKTLVPNHVVAYIDPPYLEKSTKLYQTSFDPAGGYATPPTRDLGWTSRLQHERLADYLNRNAQYRWVLSYDNHPALLRSGLLYSRDRMSPSREAKALAGVREWRISKRIVSLRYTAAARNGRGAAEELLMTTMPPATVPMNDEFRTVAH